MVVNWWIWQVGRWAMMLVDSYLVVGGRNVDLGELCPAQTGRRC